MLLAPEAGGTSVGFLIGWVVGVVGATTLFTVLAGRQWRSRPAGSIR